MVTLLAFIIKLIFITSFDSLCLLLIIDTVHFWFKDVDKLGLNHLTYLAQFISDPQLGYYKGSERLTGNLGNLRVSAWSTGISIRGSLSKYFLGSNLYTLTLQQIKEAIEKISDELHLHIAKAALTRIDIADNFLMEFTPTYYLQHLGTAGKLRRLMQSDGLYYQSIQKVLVFYDKLAQMKFIKDLLVPDEIRNANILRYEFRLTRNIAKQLNIAECDAAMLTNQSVYEKMVDLWAAHYFMIQKYRVIKPKPEAVSSKPAFRQMLMSRGILEMGGEAAVELLITQGVQLGYVKSSVDKKRLRDELKAICHNSDYTEISQAVEELNIKLAERVQFLKDTK